MAVKLHRCSTMWAKMGGHPCWKVQKALDEQGIEYELVLGPLRRGKRDDLEAINKAIRRAEPGHPGFQLVTRLFGA